MKKTVAIMMCLLCALWVTCPALAEANLLVNPGFEEVGAGSLPEGWSRDMWLSSGESSLTLSDDAYEGAHSVMVENTIKNDARFEQVVAVEPNTYYRIECKVKAEDCDLDAAGANISIKESFAMSDPAYDTNGEWADLSLYGLTGENQTSLTVLARVGGYSSENTGRAWFDAFEMIKLDGMPMQVAVQDFGSFSVNGWADSDTDKEPEPPRETDENMILLVIGLAFVLIAGVMAFYQSIGRMRPNLTNENPMTSLLAVLLVVGFGIRLIISVNVRGFYVDMNCFSSWSGTMAETGPGLFYSTTSWCDYPPGYLYVLWGLGKLIQVLRLDGSITWLIIKLPPMIMDMVAAVLIVKLATRHIGRFTAAMLAILYVFNPMTVINSAAWGQIDSVLAALMLIAIHQSIRKKWLIALPVFAIAVLIKPQALMIAPLGLFAIVIELIDQGRKKKWAVGPIVGGVAIALGLLVLLAVPFCQNVKDPVTGALAPQNPVVWLVDLYKGTLNSYPSYTINADNLYMLMGLNWKNLGNNQFITLVGWGLFALSFLYSFFLYWKAKEPNKLYVIAGTLLLLIFAFGLKMHERYAFPVLLLLIMAYAVDRDARIMVSILILSFTQFINAGMVLAFTDIGPYTTINNLISVLSVINALLLGWTGFDLCVCGRVRAITRIYKPKQEKVVDQAPEGERLLRPKAWKMRLKRVDYLLMAGLTLGYAVVAFVNLGSMSAPKTQWVASNPGEQVTFDLGELKTFHMTYFGGISDTHFSVELSEDGERYSEPRLAEYRQGLMYHWLWYQPGEFDENKEFITDEWGYPMQSARYVRITANWNGLTLNEIAFLDVDGNVLPVVSVHSVGGYAPLSSDPKNLIDEQSTVPPYPSYYNSMYFDEIYHARTAFEHLNGLHTYEYTHPPLGKVIIMLGVKIFGMTPFGWRFMGALFGVLMVPLMYLLARQLIKRPSIAFIASFLMAVDSMHFTQTRIATIDTYGVFFIMLMFFFMMRYMQMNFNNTPLWRTLVPLGLCGISMGLGIASKWIGLYAAVGLAILFLIAMVQRYREYRFACRNMGWFDADQRKIAMRAAKHYKKNLLITLCFCLVVFIVIPGLIYYFSYYWQLTPDGTFNINGVLNMQKSMFDYHSRLKERHGFESPWYEWPLIVKPMWYYSGTGFMPEGYISSISAMGNPAVWWTGLAALIFILMRYALLERGDRRYYFVLIGFAAQFLPWTLIARSTFIYHYFASVPFIILATVLTLDYVRSRSHKAYKISAIILCGVALLLFVAFYPLESGTPVLRSYANLLRWFQWYNF